MSSNQRIFNVLNNGVIQSSRGTSRRRQLLNSRHRSRVRIDVTVNNQNALSIIVINLPRQITNDPLIDAFFNGCSFHWKIYKFKLIWRWQMISNIYNQSLFKLILFFIFFSCLHFFFFESLCICFFLFFNI
jgi:hypothetical protein